MRITLSFAVTSDGYLDDCSAQRLIISTPEDWEAVHRLRAQHDAILVGAETLRRDNPSLRGVPTRITLSRSGNLNPELRFFTIGEGRRILFCETPPTVTLPNTEIICIETALTATRIVGELERRGVKRLMVEGGAQTLALFLREGLADEVRMAINPALKVGEQGYAPFHFEIPEGVSIVRENLGGMEVTTAILQPDTTEEDLCYLHQAIDASRHCTPSQSSYCVGAVIHTLDGRCFTGYTHETSPTHHAEQEAFKKALAANADLCGATIYTSMEPCSRRKSEPESCTQLILKYGLKRVVFACYEPDCFVRCLGAETLRNKGVAVRVYPELADEVLRINGHLFQ